MSMACQTSVDNFELVNRFLCFLLKKNMLYEIQNYGETERVLELHVAQTGSTICGVIQARGMYGLLRRCFS